MEPLGIAFVGVGDVAQRDYLPEFHRLAGRADLVTVMSRSEDRAREVARTFGARRWTTSVNEAVVDDGVDIVVNLTPVPVHAQVSLAAVAAGKHLYSEKPVADTISNGRAIAAAARVAGVAVVAAPSVLIFPQVCALADLVGQGAVGPIHSARAVSFGGVPPWEGYMSDPSPFFARGAGPLRDMGVYPMHALTGLFGPVVSLTASSQRTVDSFTVKSGPCAGTRVPIEADDDWHVTVSLTNGVIAEVHASFAAVAPLGPDVELFGRSGTVGAHLLDVSAPLLVAPDAAPTHEVMVPHDRSGGPDHILGIEHLLRHVQDGTPITLSLDHALHVLECLDAAERSACEGERIHVESTFDTKGNLS